MYICFTPRTHNKKTEPARHNGWRRSNRRKKPRHRNFFLEIDLHFIEGVTVEFIK